MLIFEKSRGYCRGRNVSSEQRTLDDSIKSYDILQQDVHKISQKLVWGQWSVSAGETIAAKGVQLSASTKAPNTP